MAKKKKESERSTEHKRPNRQWSSFDQFWLSMASEKGLSSSMKQSVKAHFEAKGFNSPDKFEEGLKSFGIR